jgi:hypothetical protein
MLVFWNHEDVRRTLQSFDLLINSELIDLIILDNPSKYSDKVSKLATTHPRVKAHYVASSNIEGFIVQAFLDDVGRQVFQYKYVALTESDVVLDSSAVAEATNILSNYPDAAVCSVDLSQENLLILPLPAEAQNWVPPASDHGWYLEVPTGFQFLLFPPHSLGAFMSA